MTDRVYRYMGFTIARNSVGYRICFVSYSPIFRTLADAKAWVRTLPKGLAKLAPCRCGRCKGRL